MVKVKKKNDAGQPDCENPTGRVTPIVNKLYTREEAINQRLNLEDLFRMKEEPKKLFQLLAKTGVIKNSLNCKHCNKKCGATIGKGFSSKFSYWRCRGTPKFPHQDFKCGLLVGSFFYGHDVYKVLKMMYLFINTSMTGIEISHEVGVTVKTVHANLDQFRKLITRCIQEEKMMLGGKGVEVEIDETHVGIRKRSGNAHGRFPPGMWVVGIVGKCIISHIFT